MAGHVSAGANETPCNICTCTANEHCSLCEEQP
jgi:hypothetical protein